MKGKYLITTDNWFAAPDGEMYRSVWGEVEVVGDGVLGIETNSRSTNWFVKVGSEENHVIVAGCQVHYAVKSDSEPVSGLKSMHREMKDGHFSLVSDVPTNVYIAE